MMATKSVMISAILLAAGESKRMGELKQLMPFGTSTILEQCLDNLIKSRVSEIVVVLGHRAKEVMKKIATRPVKIAMNPDYRQGMSTSIKTGLNLVDDQARAVMLTLADQPLVNSQIIDKLIQEFLSHNQGIVIPVYQGRRGHPTIFSIKYKSELLGINGDIGARQIIRDHPDDILEVAVDSQSINTDIDTISDYRTHIN